MSTAFDTHGSLPQAAPITLAIVSLSTSAHCSCFAQLMIGGAVVELNRVRPLSFAVVCVAARDQDLCSSFIASNAVAVDSTTP